MEHVEKYPIKQIPLPICDASYPGADKLNKGKDYKYPHSYPGGFVEVQYLPDELKDEVYYTPTENGTHRGRSPLHNYTITYSSLTLAIPAIFTPSSIFISLTPVE